MGKTSHFKLEHDKLDRDIRFLKFIKNDVYPKVQEYIIQILRVLPNFGNLMCIE